MKDVNLLLCNGVNISKSLELFGNMETYDEMLEDFLNEIDEKLEQIKAFKEKADMGNYAILVHSLKSDAKYFGFDKLAELAYQHELESKANHIYFVYDHYDELMDEAKHMVRVAKEYAGREVPVELERESVKSNDVIIVIDDSDIIRNFVQKIFSNRFETIIANDGAEAIGKIELNQNKNIVAILLDLNMPNVNGFAVLDYLKGKELFDKIPVFIITGVGDDEIVAQARQYPIKDVLYKPFSERDVKEAIEKATQLS